MPTRWIDFKALKSQVLIRDVLARYGFLSGLKDRGNNRLVGPCPIHGGKNGTSFNVDVDKNVFHCFSECGGGNVLDLVVKIERCDIREAAEKLADWFGLTFERSEADKRLVTKPEVRRSIAHPTPATERASWDDSGADPAPPAEHTINPPLSAPLKTLNQDHAYLWSRGLTVQTVKTFGIGFCSRGLMKGRIAIPIHNEQGELVAYAGRAIDDELAEKEGKYKLPAGFQKSYVLYNLPLARIDSDQGLIVVEGYFDVMRLHQAGFKNVVALMGSSLSEHQEQLLVGTTDRLVLMFDGDDAGAKCVREFYGRLRRRVFLKEVHLENGEQPDALSEERLKSLLS